MRADGYNASFGNVRMPCMTVHMRAAEHGGKCLLINQLSVSDLSGNKCKHYQNYPAEPLQIGITA